MSLPKKVWLVAVLLLASTAAASARSAVVESKLNLRAGPGPMHQVLLVMPAGATVTVGECRGEWCQVEYRGQRGYAVAAQLNNGTSAYATAPTPSATEYSADDAARVLNWHDREWRDRYWWEQELRKVRR